MSRLKRFALGVLIGLPLAFYVWFQWSGVFVLPAAMLTDHALTSLWADVFYGMQQVGSTIVVEVLGRAQGRAAVLSFEINPLLYSYGMPLYFGLIMATPISGRRQLALLAIGLPIVIITQSWGIVFEALRFVGRDLQDLGVASLGLHPDVVALGYQLGYLILPGVVPVVIWILGNRGFIEHLVSVESAAEPKTNAAVDAASKRVD